MLPLKTLGLQVLNESVKMLEVSSPFKMMKASSSINWLDISSLLKVWWPSCSLNYAVSKTFVMKLNSLDILSQTLIIAF